MVTPAPPENTGIRSGNSFPKEYHVPRTNARVPKKEILIGRGEWLKELRRHNLWELSHRLFV